MTTVVKYYTNLFSPDTYNVFSQSDQTISGFRMRQRSLAEKIKPGDILVCYITKLSRWCGLLEVVDGPFEDEAPLFVQEDDPFIIRFHVRPKVWLSLENSVPIHDNSIWQQLSFTKQHSQNTSAWTGLLRNSLNKFTDKDSKLLEGVLLKQRQNPIQYKLTEDDQKKLKNHTVNREDKVVSVSIPERDEFETTLSDKVCSRESIKIQALIAKIGACMGMKIWIPKADRIAVLKEWENDQDVLLDRLPLNYDDVTLRTIEQIDVLWLKGRYIVRAFEVEHTTSIYSGILRMADLLALQPNMNIKLHIVAPESRQEKVFQEIRRPVFSLLDKGPLSESCTYISYNNLQELSRQKHLDRMTDAVLDDYAEIAE